jgi:hypothetical protein
MAQNYNLVRLDFDELESMPTKILFGAFFVLKEFKEYSRIDETFGRAVRVRSRWRLQRGHGELNSTTCECPCEMLNYIQKKKIARILVSGCEPKLIFRSWSEADPPARVAAQRGWCSSSRRLCCTSQSNSSPTDFLGGLLNHCISSNSC